MPVRGVEDDVGVARSVVGQPLAQAIAEFHQALGGASQATRQVKKAQEVRQT